MMSKGMAGKRGRNVDNGKQECERGACYGNYRGYYGYRVLKDADEDPRLKYFKREWFEGKDCLDVGCNMGNLTIDIAKKFLCKSMIGIDIDKVLVFKAISLLKKVCESLAIANEGERAEPQTRMLDEEERVAAYNGDESLESVKNQLSGEDLLSRVSFKAENFLHCMEAEPTYDTILCLSVTKWIHLNWGDDGLIRLFAKIRNLLRPGGILILEPQPWKSYKSNHMASEVVRQNYHEIVLRPDQFREILLDRIGFRSMQSITEEIELCTEGFSRAVYLLRC